MKKKTVKIPPTAIMILESDESQWRSLTNGLIKELETSALITIGSNPGKTIQVSLIIEDIFPPENTHTKFTSYGNLNSCEELNNGMCRIQEHLHQIIGEGSWTFVAKLNSTRGDVPIIIQYYPVLDMFIYSFELKSENQMLFSLNSN